jgi:hypothetical protein
LTSICANWAKGGKEINLRSERLEKLRRSGSRRRKKHVKLLN